MFIIIKDIVLFLALIFTYTVIYDVVDVEIRKEKETKTEWLQRITFIIGCFALWIIYSDLP